MNLIKYDICKALLLVSGLFLSSVTVRAQDDVAASNQPVDSLAVRQDGALFGVESSRSTASVSSVTGSALHQTPAANLTNTLYGRLPGLVVMQGSGAPGADAALLRIRGAGTF